MRIFDSVLLKQYLDVGAKVKVYVNHDWYSIVDKSDLSDPIDAIGQDEYGGTHRFSYQSIEQIQVNGKIITLDMLSAKMGDKVDGGDDKKQKPDKGDKGPDLSWFSPVYDIGRFLIKEKEKRRNSGNKI
jgi:hypothetical protein